MRSTRHLLAMPILAALLWQGAAGVAAMVEDRSGARRPLAFCLDATFEQRLEPLLGTHMAVYRSILEHVPEGGWVANRSLTRPFGADEFVRTRRLGHLLFPRLLRPDLMVLNALTSGRLDPDEPIWLLDLAPEEGVTLPGFAVIDAGDGFTLSHRPGRAR